VLGRLDALREQNNVSDLRAAATGGSLKDLGYGPGAPAGRYEASRFSVYTIGTIAGGSRSDTPDLRGFDYDASGGTAGIEYRIGPGFIVGLGQLHDNQC
jgi:hypothetical protein